MFKKMLCLVVLLIVALTVPAAEPAKITVRKLKDPVDRKAGLPDTATGLTEIKDAKQLAALGEAKAKQLAEQVDFSKEKIVWVRYETGGPPFGKTAWKIDEDKPTVQFYIDEPKVAVRGLKAKLGSEFFAVPKSVTTKFAK